MCNRAVLENGGTKESVPYQYKTQEMCIRAVNFCSFVFDSVLGK